MSQAASQLSDIINAFLSGKISIFKINPGTFILYFLIMLPLAEGLTVLVYKMRKQPIKRSHLILSIVASVIVTVYMLSL